MQDPANEAPYFNREKILGRGTFATVFEGLAGVAVKRIELIKVPERFKDREEAAMKKMDDSNVVKLLDAKEDNDFKYLVLERCIGTVRDYINGDEKFNGNMPSEAEALRQMASGLDYIHSKNVVHRDIKPENVLISPSFILKISDFGCCKPMPPNGCLSVTSGPQGTRVYYAPEYLRLEGTSLTAEDRKRITADKSIDTFSLGCLFFTYIIKKGPFIHLFATPGKEFVSRETYDGDVTGNILNDRKFLEKNGIPIEHYAYDMIDGMTKVHPKDRWGLGEDNSRENLSTVLGTLKKELQREQLKK